MVDCPQCHGMTLMPDVVFFGDSVPKATVEKCYALVRGCDAILALGSSFSASFFSAPLISKHR